MNMKKLLEGFSVYLLIPYVSCLVGISVDLTPSSIDTLTTSAIPLTPLRDRKAFMS